MPSGRSFTAAALVTIAAGGDNLAVYIPLFRVGGATNLVTPSPSSSWSVRSLVTWIVLTAGRHPKARGVMRDLGAPGGPAAAVRHRRAGLVSGGDVLVALRRRDNG